MLCQAIGNIVNNAEYSLRENQKVNALNQKFEAQLHFNIERIGDRRIKLSIIDNGVGFPHNADRLFEPYVTLRRGGTGLGMPIAKQIIEIHSGSISLSSAAPFGESHNKGAEVTIYLPTISAINQ